MDFNNAFFATAAELTSEMAQEGLMDTPALQPERRDTLMTEAAAIKDAYADVRQQVPADRPQAGLVSIALLPNDDYDTAMIAKVKETIEYLVGNGTPQENIAVIVRKNKHIKMLADYFLHNPISVNGKEMMARMVSDEAFRLDASLAVNIIVKAMHWLVHPDDTLAEAFLAEAYQTIAGKKPCLANGENPRKLLPREMAEGRTSLLAMPLIGLAERLHTIFHLDKLNNQSAYVCAFFDQLSAFLKRHVADIDDFLEEWSESLCSKSIHSDAIDGIRMLTVHKSKGLEFDNVIIPFCDWDLEDSRDILWAEPETTPYSQLPVVPLRIQAKRMANSIYCKDYESEHIKNLVDNLNILYVAFTRASRNLFVFGKKDGAKYPSQIIRKSITVEDDREALTFSYGTFCPSTTSVHSSEETVQQPNIFEQKETGVRVGIESHDVRAKFLQSNASKQFMENDEEAEERARRQEYIDTGNVIHSLLSTIHNYTEIDKAIEQLEFSGVLYEKPMTRDSLRQYIEKELSIRQVKDWFSPRWQVFNECSILYYDEAEGHVREQRPDRVIYDGNEMIVIDFKTGRQLEKHKAQVRSYMRLLSGMGYGNVSGYLWYIRHNNIVRVRSDS